MLRRALTNAAAARKELKEAKTKLRYSHQGVTNDSLPDILKGAHPDVSVIDFSENAFGPLGAELISHFLITHESILSLNLSDNKLVIFVWELLPTNHNTSLDVPSLADNVKYVRKDGIVELCSGIGSLKSLESLSLSKTGLDDENIVPLSISLNNITTLRRLDLSHNKITYTNMGHLLKALNRNASSIQALDLGYNELDYRKDPAAADAFLDCLLNLPHLTDLRIGGNRFSLNFFKKIVYRKNFTKLSIPDNKLGSDIVDLFEECRANLYHLQELDLSHNSLSDDTLKGLMFPFMDMKLRSLNLSANNVGGAALIGLLCFQFDLVSLNLSFNQIDDKGAQLIAEYLMCFRHLKELDMSENSFGSEGASLILDALEISLAPLQRLNLGDDIGEVNQLRVRTILARSLKADLTQPTAAAAASHPS